VTNAVAALGVWRLHARTPRLRELAARLGVTGALAAGAYLQLILPGLVQILASAPVAGRHARLRRPGARDALATWRHRRVLAPEARRGLPGLADVAGAAPVPFAVTLALLVAALAAGAVRLARCLRAAALLLPALLPGPLVYASAWLRHDRFYRFCLVLALPGLAVLVAAGLTWPAGRCKR
jgi:hypothetical protein